MTESLQDAYIEFEPSSSQYACMSVERDSNSKFFGARYCFVMGPPNSTDYSNLIIGISVENVCHKYARSGMNLPATISKLYQQPIGSPWFDVANPKPDVVHKAIDNHLGALMGDVGASFISGDTLESIIDDLTEYITIKRSNGFYMNRWVREEWYK